MYDFPKIDLHCHLDGAVTPETAFRLAKERGAELPAADVEGLRRFITVTADCRSVNEYLKRFELPLAIMQDKTAISEIARELVLMQAQQGLRYSEIRFAPQLHTRKGLSQQDAIDAVCEGVAAGCRERAEIKCGVLLCMMSVGKPSDNDAENRETLALCEKNLGSIVRGLDLAGAEGIVPLSQFGYLFERARAAGLPFTCHAGDSQGADTVKDALDFGAKRIGHGHHIFDDRELCRRAIDEGVTLELCLTSNIQCCTQPSFEEHPARKLYDMGVKITLNTDNMVLSGVTLDGEYGVALSKCGFLYPDLIKLNMNSARAAFMDEGWRMQLLAELDSAFAAQKQPR